MAWLQDELGNWYDDGSGEDMSTFWGADSGSAVPTATGGQTYTYDDGSTLTVDQNGNPISSTESPDAVGNSSAMNQALLWVNKNLGQSAGNIFSKILANPGASIGTALAAAKALYDSTKDSGGYSKPVPKMEAVRQAVQYDDAGRAPGSSGRQYFTDTQFVPQGDAAAKEAALAAAAQQAGGLKSLQPSAAPAANPWAGKMAMNWNRPAAVAPQEAPQVNMPVVPQAQQVLNQGVQNMAHGGITQLAKGGRYLSGTTDGMADKIDTDIDGQQPAKLSHGEFVIPADVVSHLGNGNSDAGAKKLYEMMSRVRKARTGNPQQGKQIDPNKYMPGGIVGLATGGEVRGFADGGSTGTTGTTGGSGIPLDTSRTSTLSPWVGDYVTNALGQGAAMASAPYQAYTGQLTAGPSGLQQQAFAGSSEIAQAGYDPTRFNAGTFDAGAASRYMNPYISAALDPQLKELQRQNTIANMANSAQLAKAGAYGGSRQAVMNAENQRNMLDKTSQLLGQGYSTAYDKAMAQFNADQARQIEAEKATEASRQYSSDFGLKSLANLSNLGATQRDIEQQGLAADKAQFEEQRDWAYKMPQYQLNLLQGLPIGAQTSSTDQTGLSGLMSNISGLGSLYQQLAALGQAPATTTPKA